MKKFKYIYLILISFFIVVIGLIIYWQINSKNITVKFQESNAIKNPTQTHLKKNSLITHFIKNSLNSLHQINFDLQNDDNLNRLEKNLLDQKSLINTINDKFLSLDLSLKDINSPNDITETFQQNPEFEQKINSLKQDLNLNNDEKNILDNILNYLNEIKLNTNICSSDDSHIDNSVPNLEENQTEKEIMEKNKNLKQKILDGCDSFSYWNNLKNTIANSNYKNIQTQSDNFKPNNIKNKQKEQKLKIIETLEQALKSLFPNLNELNINQQVIYLPVKNNLLYQDISVNCENIKEQIQKLKKLFDIKIQNLNQKKEINLKANVIKCIELLSILKEKENYDFDYFKNNTELRKIFYFFNNSENINLKNIFSEYLKVIEINS